jgi:3-oxoacyl-[acyl-carrier-protein] synthase-3
MARIGADARVGESPGRKLKETNQEICIGYTGFGSYLPSIEVTNHDLEKLVDTTDEWIVRRTGISTRRILGTDESILDMAVGAARAAMEDAGVTANDIDDIRVGVNTWLRFPSLASQVQRVLGCTHASASDVSAGCAGFIYAVEEAYNKIYVNRVRDHRKTTALVLGVDGLSHITDWSDRGTCVLLGDGAGAVVMQEVESNGILATHTHADGRHGCLLYSDPVIGSQLRSESEKTFEQEPNSPRTYLHMDGPKTFAIAVKTMSRDVEAVIEKYNARSGASLGVDDVAFVFPHQANLRIIEAVAARLGMPLERVYTDGVKKYGNTSTASIPIGYDEMRGRGNGAPGFEVDVAFGAGFASGAVLRRT